MGIPYDSSRHRFQVLRLMAASVGEPSPTCYYRSGMTSSIRLLVASLTLGASTAGGQASARRDMATLSREFASARVPASSQLLGRWILTTDVNTERFVTGRDGPDRVLANPAGVRDSTGVPYWTLEFRSDGNGRMTLESSTVFIGRSRSTVAFNRQGELAFGQDYGGDTGYEYRCRMPTADSLICLEAHPGHAVEFRRITESRGSI
jgi:hypothetical protein